MRRVDYSKYHGRKFTRLTVTGDFRKRGLTRSYAWFECKCECGAEVDARVTDVLLGKHRSCGCLHIDTITKHDGFGTPEYRIWLGMRDRCNNPRATHYARYGGRGIKVCERWDDFGNFIADMGSRPSIRHTLDRMDNDGNYEPENCRWATRKQQANNRAFTEKARAAVARRLRDPQGRYS